MAYLKEFKKQIVNRNFPKFLQLWEEYCTCDQADVEELQDLLKEIKSSDFAPSFGKLVESVLPLWQTIQNKDESYHILKLLIDLQTTNTQLLAETTLQALKEKYGTQPQFNERLRLVGLRTKDKFQGAISNYDLINHMEKGNFVFHKGGWGTGEIMEISPIRQQITLEFENVAGRKHVTFENAFHTLVPLSKEHFFARRFADPDLLEKEAKEDPLAIIKILLRDLGPKTAAEIKDELCELVIPEADWTRWWQNARTKLKKDPIIESPESTKDLFRLRKQEITDQERLNKAIHDKTSIDEIIQSAHNFLRDHANPRQNEEIHLSLKKKIEDQLKNPDVTKAQELQIFMLLETHFDQVNREKNSKNLVLNMDDFEDVIELIDVVALKKRLLVLIKEIRKDWVSIFLKLWNKVSHSALREYILKELNQGEAKEKLETYLNGLLHHPEKQPDFFLWYFQQLMGDSSEKIPFANKKGQCQFFEAFLILLSKIENNADNREITKKLYTLITAKRYAVVRTIMEGASLADVKEFLLLAAKCHTLTDQDRKILRSLAAVVHPSLGDGSSAKKSYDSNILWTTEEGFIKVREKIKHIGDVEIVENAREIEAARALGDLRENSEFKFAKERRARLTAQLKSLSEQLQRARIITKNDIVPDEVSIGSVVEIVNGEGKKIRYTILGPWEADPDNNILSFQSQLAQAMIGFKKGDTFNFRDEEMKIEGIKSFLDKK